MAKKKSFVDIFYAKWAPIITGVGASVVIIGALFKIQHWEGASAMLIVGLGTEAVIFLLFAFQPQHEEPDWSLVYPQLKGDTDQPKPGKGAKQEAVDTSAPVKQFGEQVAELVKTGSLSKLGDSFKNLSDSVNKIGEVANVSTASKDYAAKIKEASTKLSEMNTSYGKTVSAMAELSNASQDAKNYHTQVQSITKNLSALNAVYEMELQDANSHLKALNKFYSNLSSAMENMADASKDTEQFKGELSKLTGNLTSLNNVYGSMLTAMRGQ